MNAIRDHVPALCGRIHRHTAHTWDTQPASPNDFHCDGSPRPPRSALQLVVDHPALLDISGTAGVVIAEGVRAS